MLAAAAHQRFDHGTARAHHQRAMASRDQGSRHVDRRALGAADLEARYDLKNVHIRERWDALCSGAPAAR
jgi:hypothetical protein